MLHKTICVGVGSGWTHAYMASVLPATENVERQIRLVESSPCHTQSENAQKQEDLLDIPPP